MLKEDLIGKVESDLKGNRSKTRPLFTTMVMEVLASQLLPVALSKL